MSAPIDPQRLALAREYARARRSDRLAATLTGLLSEVLADRDRLAAEAAVQQTAMVRALGQDIDGLGPPGLGRFYLVLEVPTGPLGDVLTDGMTSGRIGIVRARS